MGSDDKGDRRLMWQYKTRVLGSDHGRTFSGHISILNEMGKDDWELVNFMPINPSLNGLITIETKFVYLFKRWRTEEDIDED